MSEIWIYKNGLVDMRIHSDPTEDEQRIMGEHFNYLKEKLESGSLLLAGPCLDAAFGLVIFRAETEEDAHALMVNDPAIKQGLMTADLHRFRPSLFSPEGWTT